MGKLNSVTRKAYSDLCITLTVSSEITIPSSYQLGPACIYYLDLPTRYLKYMCIYDFNRGYVQHDSRQGQFVNSECTIMPSAT